MALQIRRTLLLALLAMVLSPAYAQESSLEWRAEKQLDGIALSSRPVEGSQVRAVRAETEIRASLEDTFKLLLDLSQRTQWDEMCADAAVHTTVDESEDIIYIHNRLPWPVNDRDMVLRRHWKTAADGSSASITTRAEPLLMPEVAGRIRVTLADGLWHIEKTGDSSVRLIAEIHADPSGPIPRSIINLLSIEAPYKAVRNLRHMLESVEP